MSWETLLVLSKLLLLTSEFYRYFAQAGIPFNNILIMFKYIRSILPWIAYQPLSRAWRSLRITVYLQTKNISSLEKNGCFAGWLYGIMSCWSPSIPQFYLQNFQRFHNLKLATIFLKNIGGFCWVAFDLGFCFPQHSLNILLQIIWNLHWI